MGNKDWSEAKKLAADAKVKEVAEAFCLFWVSSTVDKNARVKANLPFVRDTFGREYESPSSSSSFSPTRSSSSSSFS